MPEFLTLMYVRDMNLNDGRLQGTDAVVQGHRGMCVGTGIEYDAIIREAHLLHLVDEFTLHVTLIVFDVYLRIPGLQLWQILLKR